KRFMSYSPENFYDTLASEYHLISVDWEEAIRWQGSTIDALIKRYDSRQDLSVLDCTCGIGTQAIGLALKEYRVHGTDLSAESIERAKREATRLGAAVAFDIADVRSLGKSIGETFDVVLAFDNAIAHLM